MPQVQMPLAEPDFATLGCSRARFDQVLQALPETTRHYATNATHRLAEVEWITQNLEREVKTTGGPVTHEGLLSLQVYLLLTCADTLGRLYIEDGVRKRFNAFFTNLPDDAKRYLAQAVVVWEATLEDLGARGLRDEAANTLTYPSLADIQQAIQPLSAEDRMDAVIRFLFARRNWYTHESEYPQLGLHPNLAVMHRIRLGVPHTATLPGLDRLQLIQDAGRLYFAYYLTDDVVSALRHVMLRGLAHAVGLV
jgi:hypothetical protein